ncbi:MAG TPA: hypothetical protein VJ625_03985 [Propionibacteriaceae bacterium]|nr:hypothetical protein [Propionibacteriaceae bacterium]
MTASPETISDTIPAGIGWLIFRGKSDLNPDLVSKRTTSARLTQHSR